MTDDLARFVFLPSLFKPRQHLTFGLEPLM